MNDIPENVAAIQQLRIEPEEITYLVSEMARCHEERGAREVDFYTAIGILADRYPRDHERSFCVMERMQSLLSLLGDNRMKGWTIQAIEPGCTLTNEAIFRAVALCPLKANSERVWFDPNQSLKLL